MKSLLAALMLVSLGAAAQPVHTEKSTITVTGSSELSVRPDMSVVSIHLSTIKPTMSAATQTLGDQSKKYVGILKDLGFKETDVKTTNFSVLKNRVYRNNSYIDSGYVASQDVTITFPYTEAILQKIAARFSQGKDPVDFSIAFELSDKLKQETETSLISKAVGDARSKAANLASAAVVKLGAIKSIVYGSVDNTPVPMYRAYKTMVAGDSYQGENLSFTPQDIDLQQSVTIVWIIE